MEAIADITYVSELILDILADKKTGCKMSRINSHNDLLTLRVRKSCAH